MSAHLDGFKPSRWWSRGSDLGGADHVRSGGRGAPTADQHKTINGVAEGERGDQDPDVDVAAGADAADEPIEATWRQAMTAAGLSAEHA